MKLQQSYGLKAIRGTDSWLIVQARAHALLKSKEAELRSVREGAEAAGSEALQEAQAAAKEAQEQVTQVCMLLKSE